ncbi:sigma factor G inhibitor Gin [Syntrophomonas erecta]
MGYLNTIPQSESGVLLPRCSLCGQVPEKGIRGGIRIKRAFICEKCEADILNMEVGSPRYQDYINLMKEIFK